MGVEVSLCMIQTLLTALQCYDQFKEFSSFFGYKSQFHQLGGTLARIKVVLVDAETKLELSQEEKVYIDELKDALYEADDIFDELFTLAKRKELTKGFKDRYFSLFKKLEFALKMSQEVVKIKSKLDAIAYDNRLINLKHDPEPIKMRRPETCSYVRAVEIIGRDVDLEKIVDLLLQSDVQQDVSFLSIVGMGGMGKTAISQLVFNDPRITNAFSLKLWTCISDFGQGQLDIEGIRRKILASIAGVNNESATLDRVQNDIRAKLAGNRYLLVLDDVWIEDREQWSKLTSFLLKGQRGSRILVTTRSRNTARIMGDGLMHELQGLSKDDSWRLFVDVAFGYKKSNPPKELVEIGQDIVMQCANVPLAIRVMGSLLYGQDKRVWLSVQKYGLTKVEENKNGIIPILKLSYHQLQYPLKCCFVYCAIFRKGYVMKKKTLMRLWMAQGYITPVENGNMEDVAEEIFMVLLRKCFFQDIIKDEFGEIEYCKMHDLMHDVAEEIAGKDICTSDTISGTLYKKALHVRPSTSIISTEFISTQVRVRSYLPQFWQYRNGKHLLDTLLDKWKYLRVLCLICLTVKSLPSSIGDLLHLRYLDISTNSYLEMLPKEITKLYNLQTLILSHCFSLKELPENIGKLVNLRVLDIEGCRSLDSMPIDISKLECLQGLERFVVGKANSNWRHYLKCLEAFKALRNLKGFLKIDIVPCRRDRNVEKYSGGGYLLNKEHLNHVYFNFLKEKGNGTMEDDEDILEELEPHSNVKQLEMWHYQGMRMPKCWQYVNLANLVKLKFEHCLNLRCLGHIGKLHHLKHIRLYQLESLEFFIENDIKDDCDGVLGFRSSRTLKCSFFRSLEDLDLMHLPKLKGWWKGVEMGDNIQRLQFAQLSKLTLTSCPGFIAIVECPNLEYLYATNVNKKLGIIIREKKEEKEMGYEREKEIKSSVLTTDHQIHLRRVNIDNLKWLNSLQQMEAFQCLHLLNIYDDKELKSLGEGGEVFRSCSSSL